MRPALLSRVLVAGLALAGGAAGLSGTLAHLTRPGEPVIRHLLPERARLLAAEGAALRVEARPRGGGPARRGDILGIALGAPLPAAPAWIVVGDDDAAWALAARLARTEHGPVAITTADGAAWPAPRTATREHRDWRNGGGW